MQETLHEDVKEYFSDLNFSVPAEKHGRIEDRDYAVSDDVAWLVKRHPNMAVLRKIALTVARSDTETKSGIIGRRKQMAWSNEYLERLLFCSGLASPPA